MISKMTIRTVATWMLFSLILVWVMPKCVTVRGDDFGYLESVTETIRTGHFTQSDWLEPYNLPLPLLGTMIYRITCNLWVATYALLLLLAMIGFGLLQSWLKANGVDSKLLALILALSPICLNKAVEYAGVISGVVVLLGALIAWRRGWRLLFFALVLVGVANRQSCVCLLVFPLVESMRYWKSNRQLGIELLTGSIALGCIALAIGSLLPPTFARERASAQLWDQIGVRACLENVGLGCVVLIGFRASWQLLQGACCSVILRENFARPLWPIIFTAVGAWLMLGGIATLRWETPGLERFGDLILIGFVFVGAWLGRWNSLPRIEYLAYVSLYVVLVSLRGQWWDYYYIEPVLVLLPLKVDGSASGRLVHSSVGRPLLFGLLALCLVYAWALHSHLRVLEHRVCAYEEGLRSGRISITEASDAPFGFLGWKLFSYTTHRDPAGAKLSDFLRYVEGGRAFATREGLVVLRDGERRSIHPSGEKWSLPKDWQNRCFPQSDAEWRTYLGWGRQ